MCFLKIYSKYSLISDIEYDPSGNSNSSLHAEGDILNLLLFYEVLMFFRV